MEPRRRRRCPLRPRLSQRRRRPDHRRPLPGRRARPARQANPDARKLVILRIDTGAFARIVARGVESAAHELALPTALDLRYRPTQFRFAEIARAVADLEPDLVAAVGRIPHDIATAGALAACPTGTASAWRWWWQLPSPPSPTPSAPAADGFIGPSQWEPQAAVASPDFGPASTKRCC